MEVAEGEGAVLNCGPPVGHPEPNVRWKKDGLPINYTDPHYTVSPAPSVLVEPFSWHQIISSPLPCVTDRNESQLLLLNSLFWRESCLLKRESGKTNHLI